MKQECIAIMQPVIQAQVMFCVTSVRSFVTCHCRISCAMVTFCVLCFNFEWSQLQCCRLGENFPFVWEFWVNKIFLWNFVDSLFTLILCIIRTTKLKKKMK